jgi:hypothetical protein
MKLSIILNPTKLQTLQPNMDTWFVNFYFQIFSFTLFQSVASQVGNFQFQTLNLQTNFTCLHDGKRCCRFGQMWPDVNWDAVLPSANVEKRFT